MPQEKHTLCVCGNPSCAIPFGYCHCGCGEQISPVVYARNHNPFSKHPHITLSPFKIDGCYCRLIDVGQGFFTIVDADDYEWLMQWKWHKHKGCESMHRMIVDLLPGDPRKVDHIDSWNTLDNRRSNLRIATSIENGRNRRLNLTSKTGIKGVVWHSRDKCYEANIRIDGRPRYLGRSTDQLECQRMYQEAAQREFGDFARLK